MTIHPGELLDGRYTVEHVIGRGGAGVVMAARQRKRRKRVAVKVLRPDTPRDAETIARFVREGRVGAQIRSTHVARVLKTLTLDSGEPCLVLEYLEGRDLASLLAAHGPLPVAQAVSYVRQACMGLAVAHARGIVHLDLKPSNLFVCVAPDGSHVVKLIDFGMAQPIAPKRPRRPPSANDDVMGSPPFVSPEQLRGEHAADPRTDVWALGAVLFTLLAGRSPFERRHLTETYRAILTGDVADLDTLRSDVPRALAAAVKRCLSVDIEQRFSTVAELGQVLAS